MLIIKIGGGKEINVEGIVKGLSELDEKFIIVHGANALRDNLASDLNKEKKVLTSVKGYSSVYSDEEAINLIMMSYSGLKNKKIVELCQQNGINAVGLSGVDGKLVQSKRNSGIRVKEDGKTKIIHDFSGKPKKINKELLELLLDNGYVPVVTIPTLDENNFAVNSENDDIVNALEKEFHADKVIQLIEAPGFLENKDDPGSVIKEIKKEELEAREQKVEGRMKRKVLALRKLFEQGASEVIISDGRTDNPIKNALEGKGTIIK
jgi:acetylglutamate/LysW-gamma-L-alpha-aminoadipate kinase